MSILNFDELLNTEAIDIGKLWTIAGRCLQAGFIKVGSNSIMELPDSDIDFMCEHNDTNVDQLRTLGFVEKVIGDLYMDNFTVAVWYHPDIPNSLQVVTKDPAHWIMCQKMWEILKANPNLYRDYFWKSNPNGLIDRNMVRERINAFGWFISVLEQTGMELELKN